MSTRKRVVAVTGSASGIGAAVRARLERDGQRIIGIDLRGQEVSADLSTPQGRASAVEQALAACEGRLDGLVCCAGLGPQVEPSAKIVAVNYFGAVRVLEGLRSALAAGDAPSGVAISSNSATLSPAVDGPLCAACLSGDENRACDLAGEGAMAYAGSKLALARWVRRSAVTEDWAGQGIRLNAVAPGAVMTPLLQGGLDHARLGDAIRGLPIPLGGFGQPDQIAAAVAFLLGPESTFCCGTVLFADGGSDALIRPERL